MQIIETAERGPYQDFLEQQHSSVLQSWHWGDFQKRLGRKAWRLLVTNAAGMPRAAATVVKMPLSRGHSYFYIPHGPIVAESGKDNDLWWLLLDKIADLSLLEKPIFLRIDPKIEKLPSSVSLEDLGFHKLGWEIQPRDTLLLDLTSGNDAILHQMKPKTRYNIRLAERKGVSVEVSYDTRSMKSFWELMKETTKRDGFSSHPYQYYAQLMETLGKNRMAATLIAIYQRRPIASLIMTNFAGTATYLHGASSDRFRASMAPYLMQWKAVVEAKENGARKYDFGGIARTADNNHPWSGLTRFKRGFGGKEVTYIGAYDLVYNRAWYSAYRIARFINRKFS